MGLFDAKQTVQVSNVNQESLPAMSSAIIQADQNCKAAEDAVKEAIQFLGKKYFEANQDNKESEFYTQISNVKECIEKEKLWHLYRLSLEDKTQCDNCSAIITADSVFCNKCGTSIKPRDYSIIGLSQIQPNNNISSDVCPSCGNPLVAGAMFCEKCGCKVPGGTQ